MLRRFTQTTTFATLCARYMTVVRMPALSPTMESGKIIEWTKKVGQKVAVGDQFCSLETDKATVAFNNADDEMWLARIVADNGASAKVGDPICLCVDEEGELDSDEVKSWTAPAAAGDAAPAAPAAPAAAEPAAPAAPAASAAPAAAPAAEKAAPQSGDGRIFASPAARRLAKELGVDLEDVEGTGGNGRITKEDVEKAAASPKKKAASGSAAAASPVAPVEVSGGAAAYEDIPISSMRATIARRLTQSKNVEVPHYYLMNEARADNMLATIKALNAKGDGKYKITVNDFFVKAIARANLIVPQCNSHWCGDFIRQFRTVDVSVAVATPTGLITPVIRNAHARGLADISVETKELAKKARDGLLQPNEYQGGTVTISNLGGMGIPNFTAIINQPHSMILAVGTTVPKPEIVQNEETGEYEMTGKVEQVVSFTASFDHRVVDGAVGAEWMKHFKDAIENPLSLLL